MSQQKWLGFLLVCCAWLIPTSVWAQSSRVFHTDELLNLMRQAVQQQYEIPGHDVLILWNDDDLEDKLAKLGNNLSVEVPEADLRNLIQRNTLMLKVMDGDLYKGRIPVRFQIDGWAETYQTTQTVAKGKLLSEQSIKAVRAKLSALPPQFVRSPFRFEDFEARQDISSGTILRQGLLQERPLVQRGAAIRVIVVNENLRLVAQGEALETGARNALIRVKILNFGSQEIVRARVSNESEVILDIGS